MRVLGIETSCDETAAAVYDGRAGLLSHALHSQIQMHAAYGGVVPELASRDHLRRLLPPINTALVEANTRPEHLDGVAYTAGPGLVGALLVGLPDAGDAGRFLGTAIGVLFLVNHDVFAHAATMASRVALLVASAAGFAAAWMVMSAALKEASPDSVSALRLAASALPNAALLIVPACIPARALGKGTS